MACNTDAFLQAIRASATAHLQKITEAAQGFDAWLGQETDKALSRLRPLHATHGLSGSAARNKVTSCAAVEGLGDLLSLRPLFALCGAEYLKQRLRLSRC